MCAINHETVIDQLAVDLAPIEALEYGWIVCNEINEIQIQWLCSVYGIESSYRQMNAAAFLSCNSNLCVVCVLNLMFTQFR